MHNLGHCHAQVMDMLVEQTHEVRHEWRNNERPMRYTDTRLDEQHRAVSLKMVPMSLLLESSTGKSFLMNLIDAPGEFHPPLCTSSEVFCSCVNTRVFDVRKLNSCRKTAGSLVSTRARGTFVWRNFEVRWQATWYRRHLSSREA